MADSARAASPPSALWRDTNFARWEERDLERVTPNFARWEERDLQPMLPPRSAVGNKNELAIVERIRALPEKLRLTPGARS